MREKQSSDFTVTELMRGYWSDRSTFQSDNMVGFKRVASYTRYSSDAQSHMSITRQDNVIEAYGKRGGYPEIPDSLRFSDEAKTGSNTNREGLQALLASATRKEFDVLFVEDLDRLSRDLANLAVIHKELKRLGIEIHASTYGRVTDIHVAFYGLFGMEQRLSLRRRTSLGRWIASINGRNAHGKAYGYSPGRKPGRLYIVKSEADIIRRIFQWFSEGLTPVQIAGLLNDGGVSAPLGGKWSAQTIAGTGKYGTGILRNPKYVGILVYGRTEVLPGTEGRKRDIGVRSDEKWLYVTKKSWQIVERRLWVIVQLRLAKQRETFEARMAAAKLVPQGGSIAPLPRVARKNRSTDLFQGLYRCTCGERMYSYMKNRVGRRKLTCQSASQYGDCKKNRSLSVPFLEVAILRAIRDRVVCDDARRTFVEEYGAEVKRIEASSTAEIARREQRIKELDFLLERSVIQAIYEDAEDIVIEMRKVWKKEKNEHREKLRALMSAPSEEEVALKIETVEDLASQIDEIIVCLPMAARTESEIRLVAALRNLVLDVTVDAPPGEWSFHLSVRTTLAGLASDLWSLREKLPVQTFELKGTIKPGPQPLAACEKKARSADLAERSAYATTDTDWASLETVLADFKYARRCNRFLFDAALFHLRTGLPLKKLPAPYDGGATIYNGVKQMTKRGYFARGIAALEHDGSASVLGLDTTKLMGSRPTDDRTAA